MYDVLKGSAQFVSEDRQMIDVVILVDGSQYPYTSNANSTDDIAREIYTRAVFGEYGEVKPYAAIPTAPVPEPTAAELLRQIAALQRQVQALTEK